MAEKMTKSEWARQMAAKRKRPNLTFKDPELARKAARKRWDAYRAKKQDEEADTTPEA